jgi:peptidoglycan/LPS O-acetylase OafA/YrhL
MPFFLTPCRWDGLAAGAFVATLADKHGIQGLRQIEPASRIILAVAVLVLTAFFFTMKGLWFSNPIMATVGLSIVSAMFAALLVIVLVRQDTIGAIVGAPWLRFFGKYSYGLYVIHGLLMPVLFWAAPDSVIADWPTIGVFAIAAARIAICVPLAMLSWRIFESPILGLKRYFQPHAAMSTPSGRLSFAGSERSMSRRRR